MHNSPEDIERNWAEWKKEDRVNPRAIRRQHRFKPGHGPHDDNPHEPWRTLLIKPETPREPDQRHLLTGGPESGVPCSRCGEMTRVAGKMSRWDVMTQQDPDRGIDVRPIDTESISESRRKELRKEFIVALKCPRCYHTDQWDEAFLPAKLDAARAR